MSHDQLLMEFLKDEEKSLTPPLEPTFQQWLNYSLPRPTPAT